MHTNPGGSKAGWFIAAAIGLVIIAVLVVAIGGNPFKSDLEVLNENIAEFNQVRADVESNLQAYTSAESETQQLRISIADVSDENPTYLGIVDERIGRAESHYQTAQQLLSQAGPALTPAEVHTKEADAQVDTSTDLVKQANQEMQAAFDELAGIRQLMTDLDVEYMRQFLWFEIASYWPSENSYSNHTACYYGEVVSTINPDGSINEAIVDDSVDTGFMDGEKGKKWKIFTVKDYDYLVSQGIVPAMDKDDPSETDVGKYLCGEKPQDGKYGALGEPPITLVKEQGALNLSQEDEDAMVGSERYGAWCAPDGSGEYKDIPEGEPVPQTAEWCWHMPEGGDPRFYYFGFWNGSSWGYTQGPRRCYDCSSSAWSGGTLVPANQMSQVTGMDAPSVRNPPDDGGPGSGK